MFASHTGVLKMLLNNHYLLISFVVGVIELERCGLIDSWMRQYVDVVMQQHDVVDVSTY